MNFFEASAPSGQQPDYTSWLKATLQELSTLVFTEKSPDLDLEFLYSMWQVYQLSPSEAAFALLKRD